MNNPAVSPIETLYISQLLFGCLYALLIHWLSVNDYLPGSTAWSVVVGDAMTLFIQWLFIREDWNPMVTFGSFAFSGLPMFVSYMVRHQQQTNSHKRRALPNHAMHVRDDAVMELKAIISKIVDEDVTVAKVVHRLYQVVGTLKSM